MIVKLILPKIKKLKSIFFSFILMLSTFSVEAQLQIGTDIFGDTARDFSGRSLEMPDASTVAIGAPGNDGNGFNSGHVRVYKLINYRWVQKGADIDGEAINDNSGYDLSMSDSNTVAIGAPYNDGNGNNAGHVRVYRWNGTAWVQKGGDIDGEAAGDRSGWFVNMPDSNTVAIGALYNDGNGIDAGHVRIYSWNGNTWIQKGNDIDGEAAGDYSGVSVYMSDSNTVAIGAPGNAGNGVGAGHVRIYSWNGNNWIQKGSDIDGEAAGDRSGWSVNMPDSNTVAVGAILNAGNGVDAGHVRIYRWDGSSWIQKGSDIDGAAAGDYSGYRVSMADSNTVAIGAQYNDSNGVAAGHARIFSWGGNSWIQKGSDIHGVATGDILAPVSMPDANTVAVGAERNDGNGTCAGHVSIYSLCNSDTTISITACKRYTSPSGNYTWTNSGNYIDAIPNSASCDSIMYISLSIISPDTSLTISNDTLISNNVNATYQWVNCDSGYVSIVGDTNRIFIPPNNDNYAVILTQNGCSDTSSCYSVLVSGLSKEIREKENFIVYPNPSSGLFTIENINQTAIGNIPFEVRDITGKKVLKGKLSGNQTTVDLSGYSSGVYLLRVGNENMKIIRK